MKTYINSPELAYLSPTTRERAILIAQQLINSSQVAPADAIKMAILQAKNWAVKNVNRNVWKRLKQSDKELV